MSAKQGNQVVLQLRIYAMYGQDRAVLILTGVTFVIVKIWVLILLGFFSASVKGKYMPFELTVYADLFSSDIEPNPWYGKLLRTTQQMAILLPLLDATTLPRGASVLTCSI